MLIEYLDPLDCPKFICQDDDPWSNDILDDDPETDNWDEEEFGDDDYLDEDDE